MLTDTKVKNLKTRSKPYKVSDSNGLYIYVTIKGTKFWRQKYRINHKEKLLAHGEYPFTTLSQARQLRDKARELIKQGIDPAIEKKADKANKSNTFENIARNWHEAQASEWSDHHTQKVITSLEKDIFPSIGNMPIADITTALLLNTLKIIEKRGAYEQAKRVSQRCDSVFKFAIVSDLIAYNPAQELQGALKKPSRQNYNHIEAKELPSFVGALNALEAHPIVKLATEMLMLTFVRTSELIKAEWPEIDFDNKLWEIPAERMKIKKTKDKKPKPHLVPLSERVIEILAEIQQYNGHRQYIFASPNKPRQSLSNNAILQAIKRMGYAGKMTGHGFRHLASTTLNEMGYNPDAIEIQLAHVDGSTRGVYNKAKLLEERIKLMRDWSKFVVAQSSKVVPIRGAK